MRGTFEEESGILVEVLYVEVGLECYQTRQFGLRSQKPQTNKIDEGKYS